MTQSNFNLPNTDGATFRSNNNTAHQAHATWSAGSTAPSTTYPYQVWVDTANSLLKRRNSANTAWITEAELDGTNPVRYDADQQDYTPNYTGASSVNLRKYLDRSLKISQFLTSEDPTVDQSTELRNAIVALFDSEEHMTLDLEGRQIPLSSDVVLRCGQNGFTSDPSAQKNRYNCIKNGKLFWFGGDSASDTEDYMLDIGCPSSVKSESAFLDLQFSNIVFDARTRAKNLFRFFNYFNCVMEECHFRDYDTAVGLFLSSEDDGGTYVDDNAMIFEQCSWQDNRQDSGQTGRPVLAYCGDNFFYGGLVEGTGPLDMHVGSLFIHDVHFNNEAGNYGVICRDPRDIRVVNCDLDGSLIKITNAGYAAGISQNATTNMRSIIVGNNNFFTGTPGNIPSGEGIITVETENSGSDLTAFVVFNNVCLVSNGGDNAVDVLRVTTTGSGSYSTQEGHYHYVDGFGVKPGGDAFGPDDSANGNRTFVGDAKITSPRFKIRGDDAYVSGNDNDGLTLGSNGVDRWEVKSNGSLQPSVDDSYYIGSGSNKVAGITVSQFAQISARSSAPTAVEGRVAFSDGSGGGFDGSSGKGLYVYSNASWVFIAG